MRHSNQGRFRLVVQFLRRQFLQDGDLPFAGVLSEDLVAQTLTAVGVVWKDRIYMPLVTLWVFLGQVLSADHSCLAAVARLIAQFAGSRKPCLCAQTGAYWQARERLPEKMLRRRGLLGRSCVGRQSGSTMAVGKVDELHV